MSKISKIIILLVFIIFVILIVKTEIKIRPKLSLINDVEKIVKNIEELNYSGETIEIIIDNGYEVNSRNYDVKGEGVIFLEKEYSIMLSRNGMCALKMPYSDEVMFQEEECPKYRLIENEKVVIN